MIRWEKELGLPVHRYPGKSKGGVYAHISEMKEWANGPRRVAAERKLASESASVLVEPPETPPADDFPAPPSSRPAASSRSIGVRGWLVVGVGLLAAFALTGFAIWRSYRHQPISSVAVLPFDNLGTDSDLAFSEGLTDEIASSLSRLDGVRVAGRSSAYTFRGKHRVCRR